MTLEVFATHIECYESTTNSLVFRLETQDTDIALLKVDTLIAPGEPLEELFNAIREAISKLELKCGK